MSFADQDPEERRLIDLARKFITWREQCRQENRPLLIAETAKHLGITNEEVEIVASFADEDLGNVEREEIESRAIFLNPDGSDRPEYE